MDGYSLISGLALLLTGWVVGAESASWRLVQPVIAGQDEPSQVRFEQGLLRTYGRVMPVVMPLTGISLLVAGLLAPADSTGARVLWLSAAGCSLMVVVTTLAVNVPINTRTAQYDAATPPPGWRAERERWSVFQGVRVGLLGAAFVLAVVAVVR